MNPPERRRLLPPRALKLSWIAQIPGVMVGWPPHPTTATILGGVALVAAGIGLNLAAVRQFQAHKVGVVPFSPAAELAADGPFRFTRNPMYLGLIALSASPAVAVGAWFNLAAPAVLAVWLHQAYVLKEEAFLRERFGAVFEAYARRIPRWLGIPKGL